jgi:uncharacterized protein (DUF1501 family)
MSETDNLIDHEAECEGCREYNELSRRKFITDAAGLAGLSVFGIAHPSWLPKVVMAESYDSARDVIVAVFNRGGHDGLSIVVPYGDANYYAGRPTIAIPRPDAAGTGPKLTALDSFFGFPPAMSALLPAYKAGALLPIQAVGSTNSSRSHFDAQKYMEVGKPADPTIGTGWLGRHLATAPPMRTSATLRGIGFADGLQQMLVGAPKTLPIPDPSNYSITGNAATRAERTTWLRNDFTGATEPLQASALDALNTLQLLSSINITGYVPANGAVYPNSSFGRAFRSTAALIKADIGVEAIQIDLGGWDTHTNADPLTTAGAMYRNMLDLSGALGAFYADVMASATPTNVTVVTLSEFGRNARENGGKGTDHGRGNCMFVMGRNVAGGRVMTFNWPGLARENLESGQDLKVTLDHRDVLAEIVQNRLNNPNVSTVFPGYTPTFRGVTK